MTGEADVVAELHTANKSQAPEAERLQRLEKEITQVTGNVPTGIAFRNQMNLIINKEKLLLYNVSYDELTRYSAQLSKRTRFLLYAPTSNICLSVLPGRKRV